MSAILCEDRFDSPQIVRPLLPGERLPFYSTAELLLGVCHLARVILPPVPAKKAKQQAPWKTIEFKNRGARDKFNRLAPQIADLLRQHKTNWEIANEIEEPVSLVAKYLRRNEKLRDLSAARPRNTGNIKERKKTSATRFVQLENEIRRDTKEIGITAAAMKHKFDRRTLQRFLEASNAEN